MSERRQRIGDWLVPYDDATSEVVVERTLSDILHATPGSDRDCMNSRCIKAQRNRHVFPHDVHLVSTTAKRVYVVDRVNEKGEPQHAIRYELSERDRRLINLHDRYGVSEPGELRLRIPNDPKGSPKRRARKGKRFGDYEPGQYPKDTGKQKRPITSHSLGAKARYQVAVGSLRDNDDD